MNDVNIQHSCIQGLISEIINPDLIYEEASFVGTIDKQLSVCVPVGLVAYIDAIASRYEANNVSRASVIRDILHASIFDILNGVDNTTKCIIEKSAEEILPNIVPDKMKKVAARFSVTELCGVVEV